MFHKCISNQFFPAASLLCDSQPGLEQTKHFGICCRLNNAPRILVSTLNWFILRLGCSKHLYSWLKYCQETHNVTVHGSQILLHNSFKGPINSSPQKIEVFFTMSPSSKPALIFKDRRNFCKGSMILVLGIIGAFIF